MITGIVVALPEEAQTLTKKKLNKGECIEINEHTLLVFSGAGPANATKASQLLVSLGAKRLISWGCAAALENNLKPGDLILSENLLSESNEKLPLTSPWLNHTLKQLLAYSPDTGLLIESSFIVKKSSAKTLIHQQSKAKALDMESIAVAKVARQHGHPLLVIRCIADPASQSLPLAVSRALNEQGDIELPKLLYHLLTHPQELPNLIKLGLHFKAATNKLKLVAKHLDIIIGFEQNTAAK